MEERREKEHKRQMAEHSSKLALKERLSKLRRPTEAFIEKIVGPRREAFQKRLAQFEQQFRKQEERKRREEERALREWQKSEEYKEMKRREQEEEERRIREEQEQQKKQRLIEQGIYFTRAETVKETKEDDTLQGVFELDPSDPVLYAPVCTQFITHLAVSCVRNLTCP